MEAVVVFLNDLERGSASQWDSDVEPWKEWMGKSSVFTSFAGSQAKAHSIPSAAAALQTNI